jgi:hypothetical protein
MSNYVAACCSTAVVAEDACAVFAEAVAAVAGVDVSANGGWGGIGGTVPPITGDPLGNAPTRGRPVSGQDESGGLASSGPAALRFDGLPGVE